MQRTLASTLLITALAPLALAAPPPAPPLPLGTFNPLVVLGEIHGHGYGGPKDFRRARAYYQLAADQSQAQFRLGQFYERGWGGPLNLREAVRCYERAAQAGHGEAQLTLANLLSRGRKGLPPDQDRARHWYGRAAAGSGGVHSRAQLLLAQMALTGTGGPYDFHEARRLLRQAAAEGDQTTREAANHYLKALTWDN